MPDQLRHDLLVYGLDLKDIDEPFKIGDYEFYPQFNLRNYFRDFEKDKVEWRLALNPIYASCIKNLHSRGNVSVSDMFSADSLWQREVRLILSAFRLFQPGWLQVEPVLPVLRTKLIRIILDLDAPPTEQIWADPVRYNLGKSQIAGVQALHNRLIQVPEHYLDVALTRFNRSYEYILREQIDDCFADLVIALESLTSRGGDGILQSMKLRISLLLSNKGQDRKAVEKTVGSYYDHRSQILHGGKVDIKKREERVELIESLRSMVREVILVCMCILEMGNLQKTMAETIDEYLYSRLKP